MLECFVTDNDIELLVRFPIKKIHQLETNSIRKAHCFYAFFCVVYTISGHVDALYIAATFQSKRGRQLAAPTADIQVAKIGFDWDPISQSIIPLSETFSCETDFKCFFVLPSKLNLVHCPQVLSMGEEAQQPVIDRLTEHRCSRSRGRTNRQASHASTEHKHTIRSSRRFPAGLSEKSRATPRLRLYGRIRARPTRQSVEACRKGTQKPRGVLAEPTGQCRPRGAKSLGIRARQALLRHRAVGARLRTDGA